MKEQSYTIPAVILTGGQSRRMGRPKAFLPVGGDVLIHRVSRMLEGKFFPLYVSVKSSFDDVFCGNLPIIHDRSALQTPVAGIASALRTCREQGLGPWVFITCCDLLVSPEELIDVIIKHAVSYGRPGAAVLQDARGIAPFPGLYHTETVGYWEEALERGTLRLQKLLHTSGFLHMVPRAETDARFPDWKLWNINTPEDLSRYAEHHGYLEMKKL